TFFLQNAIAQSEKLIYHNIKTDATGNIISWYNDEPGKAWSHVINLVWDFWDTMRVDMNGLPYYMNHQVWKENVGDSRGIGGDQFAMALSSWRLLYAYTGNDRIQENMRFIADYYITHSFSDSKNAWANIPYPYNTKVYSGIYDGDMILGKNYTQPDKAGSFGLELVHLYKMIHKERYPNVTDDEYLNAAIKIAYTLAKHTVDGDENSSPLPFKVNAVTGKIGELFNNNRVEMPMGLSSYTTNWSGTLELLLELQQLKVGDMSLYKQAFNKIISWMKKYPLQNNKWGPFFEDISGWSDTQINAITFAQFMMNHTEYFPNWKTNVMAIFNWVYEKLANEQWRKYGVTVVNEQTAYHQPGNSHTSREAAAELQYIARTKDSLHFDNAVRQLNWATYMVDGDGKNCYPNDENWLTDGYGDYVRHFLRAMAAVPALAPSDEEHILSSTSVVEEAVYAPMPDKLFTSYSGKVDPKIIRIFYRTFDTTGIEQIRMMKKPSGILLNFKSAIELKELNSEGFTWSALDKGGILTIKRTNIDNVLILE
ncbi:MAG: hypothetical protein ABI091_13935, partial [Ferruginibacter sp.]